MLKTKYFLLFLLFASVLFAQQKKKITREEYNKEFEKVTLQKETLLKQKKELKATIEALEKKSAHLDSVLKACMPSYLIHKYGKKIGTRIALGKVWKGMTERMLVDSWGKPDRITTNRKKYGIFRQYYYGKIIYFFRDGRLIDWEEKK